MIMLKVYFSNPFKKAFQFEYSLFNQITMRFAGTSCRSITADRLYLYYRDAPYVQDGENSDQSIKPSDIAISRLLQRDVFSHINFPMMSICHATVHIMPLENGLHEFVFTDDIYTFSVSLRMDRAYKKLLGINVTV